MKVLHLISSGGMYGAEAVILNLSRAMREQGHQSVLGVFGNQQQPNLELLQRAEAEDLETCTVLCQGQVDRTVPATLRALREHTGADIIHAHGYKADVYAWAAFGFAAHPRTPLISTCHTWYDNDLSVRLYGALDRTVLRRYTRVIAVSEEVRARLLRSGVSAERVRPVRNGIDLRPFAAAADARTAQARPGPLCVGLVGRLAPEKGVDLFLQAAALVRKSAPDARFVIVGDGPERAPLERLLAKLDLDDDAVYLAGRGENMPEVYAGFDLLVSSSRQEGLPIALLEGLASGLPLVATAVGEVPNLIVDGQTGILVPREDVSALSTAILGLLQSEERRQQLGQAGRAHVAAHFSIERMTEQYLEVYAEAMLTAEPVRQEPRS